MKNLRLILIACLLAFASNEAMSQTIEQVRGIPANETKAEKKARAKKLKALADSVAHIDAVEGLKSQYFVITAERMTLGNSGRMYASPNQSTNFVLVQGDNATVQIAFDNGRLGLNGLGGITVDGTVSGVKCTTSKKGDIYYDFSVQGVAISAQVSIVLYKDGNSAMAMVNPNFNSQKMTIYGPLVPYKHGE